MNSTAPMYANVQLTSDRVVRTRVIRALAADRVLVNFTGHREEEARLLSYGDILDIEAGAK